MKAPKTRLRLDLTNNYVKNREIKINQKVKNLIKATNPKQQQTIKDFQDYLKNLGKAPNTVVGYCFSVKRILDKYNGRIEDYTSKDWIKFFENRPENWNGDNNRASQIGQVAMERLLEMVHGLSNKGKVFDILYSKYPKVKIKHRKHQRKEFFDYDDLKKMLRAAKNSRDRFFIYGLYESACRISEFLSIRLCDIDFTKDPIELGIISSKTAEGKDNCVFIVDSQPELMQYLKDHPSRNDYETEEEFYCSKCPLIANRYNGKPLDRSTTLLLIKRLARESGIKKTVYNHLFRGSRVTNLYHNEDFDIHELKELGRWASMNSLDLYVGRDMRKIAQKLKKNNLSKAEKEKLQAELSKTKDKRKSLEKITCHNCRTINEHDNIRCKQCGAPLSEKEKYKAWKEQQSLKEQMAQLVAQVSELTDLKAELKKRKKV